MTTRLPLVSVVARNSEELLYMTSRSPYSGPALVELTPPPPLKVKQRPNFGSRKERKSRWVSQEAAEKAQFLMRSVRLKPIVCFCASLSPAARNVRDSCASAAVAISSAPSSKSRSGWQDLLMLLRSQPQIRTDCEDQEAVA